MYYNLETQELNIRKLNILSKWVDDEIGVEYEVNTDDETNTGNLVIFDLTANEVEQIKEVESQIINNERLS